MTMGVIRMGDYIDLESLSIAGYPVDNTTTGYGKLTNAANTNLGGGKGTLLRLIVVGINSFNGLNKNGDDPRLVFQFKNLPVMHRMNSSATNTGGYQAGEGREYLAPVSGKDGSGAFLTGLKNAGVPFGDAWMWAPKRYVANGGKNATLSDQLWLPTEREMFGENTGSSSTYETAAKQARLAYYDSASARIKYTDSSGEYYYWLAFAYGSTSVHFCTVLISGEPANGYAPYAYSFAPALCVK
jgi:hypothetical protein